jgi:hypothetical protein
MYRQIFCVGVLPYWISLLVCDVEAQYGLSELKSQHETVGGEWLVFFSVLKTKESTFQL